MKVAIVVGTVSGNAHLLAETVVEWLAERGHEGEILGTGALPRHVLGRDGLLAITSTCGNGELPETIQPFASALAGTALADLACGVIGLGDSLYGDSYSRGGKTMAQLLTTAGGTMLLPPLDIDAGSHPRPEVPAGPWLDSWLEALEKHPRRNDGGGRS